MNPGGKHCFVKQEAFFHLYKVALYKENKNYKSDSQNRITILLFICGYHFLYSIKKTGHLH